MKKVLLALTILFVLIFTAILFTSALAADKEGPYTYYPQEDGSAVITKYSGKASTVKVPNTLGGCPVTIITEDAFSYCYSIKSLTLPEGLTTINPSAFAGCINLVSIKFPKSLTTIGNYAFYNCRSIKSLELPDDLKSISDSAFSVCTSLASVKPLAPHGHKNHRDTHIFPLLRLILHNASRRLEEH